MFHTAVVIKLQMSHIQDLWKQQGIMKLYQVAQHPTTTKQEFNSKIQTLLYYCRKINLGRQNSTES